MPRLTKPLHPDAAGLSMFRVLANGEGRAYTSVTGSHSRIDQSLRMAQAFGYVAEDATEGDYAVLDVHNVGGDIIDDYTIPHAKAARWWYRHLGLRIEHPSEDVREWVEAREPVR